MGFTDYALDLHSDNVPDVGYKPPIGDLFEFAAFNWSTLGPALWLLFGTLFAFFVLKLLKMYYY